MNDKPASRESPQKTTLSSKVLAVSLGGVIAVLAPLALFLITPLQQLIQAIGSTTFHSAEESYDPAGPLKTLVSNGAFSHDFASKFLMLVALSILSILIGIGVYFALVRPLYRNKANRGSSIAFSIFAMGSGAGAFAAIMVFAMVIEPNSANAVARAAEPSHVAQWAESRYGLDISESDAEELVDQTSQSGDPTLIDGRLLKLTRIAQGGYVLTEDGAATELPTKK